MTERPDEDGYDGPAELIDGETVVAARASLRGHFDPISGNYYWYGRIDAAPEVSELVRSAAREVLVRTPQGEAVTALTDVDPWGRPRVEGFGVAPFAVLTDLPGA